MMNARCFLVVVALAATPSVAIAQDAMNADMAIMEKMMSSMQGMKPSGDPDMDFTMMMIPHHQSAIDMAKVQLEEGDDPQLRAMAEKIIAAQEKEIEELKAWQAEHGH
jgi:uncharacterized protein (DUF305 family)